MKIVFINLPQPYLVEKHAQVPLGLLYLSSTLKRECPGIEVSIVDFSDKTIAESAEELEEADVYGITSVSLDYHSSLDLKEAIRARFPNSRVILGGPHSTVATDLCLKDGFDSVFVGEAESTLVEFFRTLEAGEPVKKVYKTNDWVDLACLPWPDRLSFPWLGGSVLAKGNDRSVNIMASRGCLYNCSFCASETIWHRKLRWRPVDDVIAEIKYCKDEFGIDVYRFADDNMTSNLKWTREFCKKLKPLGVEWRISVRVDTLPRAIVRTMREAGCVEMSIGVESFDDNVLDALNKRIKAQQSIDAINILHEEGVGARLLMMVSTPGERYAKPDNTIDKNIEALELVKGKYVFLSPKVFMPLPGTLIWSNPEKYDIEIMVRDFSRYNYFIYQLENGQTKRVGWSPIRFKCMTEEQQQENIDRMLDYTEELGFTT